MTVTPSVGRVARRGLANEAAHLIRDAIMNGALQPGDVLRENDLAESLGVSRGSVREGLSLLEREGIIRTGWHQPARVIPANRNHARNLYQLRAGLERIAAQTVVGRATESDFEPALDEIRNAVRNDAGRASIVRVDLKFHDVVYRIADNGPLTNSWMTIRSQIQLFQLLRSSPHDRERETRLVDRNYETSLIGEHEAYAAILTEGDSESAARYAEQHVDSALKHLLLRLND